MQWPGERALQHDQRRAAIQNTIEDAGGELRRALVDEQVGLIKTQTVEPRHAWQCGLVKPPVPVAMTHQAPWAADAARTLKPHARLAGFPAAATDRARAHIALFAVDEAITRHGELDLVERFYEQTQVLPLQIRLPLLVGRLRDVFSLVLVLGVLPQREELKLGVCDVIAILLRRPVQNVPKDVFRPRRVWVPSQNSTRRFVHFRCRVKVDVFNFCLVESEAVGRAEAGPMHSRLK